MTDLGLMIYVLGIEVKQSYGRNFVCEQKYVRKILKNVSYGEMQKHKHSYESKGKI